MYRLRILLVGKTKESWLEQALDEYIKRLQHHLTIDFIWAKDDQQLIQLATKEDLLICLDSEGQMFDSVQFSSFLLKQFEKGHSRLAIAIGGPEGLPPSLKSWPVRISLSAMTFTHQIVRLILLEQIYRAFEIAKGSGYHK